MVGVQPFGGMGLSGTGPKAGGPHYLPRFATEQTVTTNTAAVGGNATLLSLEADSTAGPDVPEVCDITSRPDPQANGAGTDAAGQLDVT